jgi:hypothetical protein
MTGAQTLRAKVVSRQVPQFATNLKGSKSKKMPRRLGLHGPQSPVESKQRGSEDVIGFLPPSQSGKFTQHLAT